MIMMTILMMIAMIMIVMIMMMTMILMMMIVMMTMIMLMMMGREREFSQNKTANGASAFVQSVSADLDLIRMIIIIMMMMIIIT